MRVLLLLSNESFQLFPPKFAGEFSLYYYKALFLNEDLFKIPSFIPQMIFNLGAFSLFGANRINIILTNAFLLSFSSIIAFVYLYRIYNVNAGIVAFLLIMFYPATLNFSMFGLRDPVVFFLFLSYILSFLFVIESRDWAFRTINFFVCIISMALALLSRPEMLPVIAFLPYIFLLRMLFFKISKIKIVLDKFVILIVSVGFILIVTIGGGYFATRIVLAQIGVTNLVSPLVVATEFADKRYERQFLDQGGSEGGGGAILPPNIYYTLPGSLRIVFQTIGIIILPFPWLIDSLDEGLASLDSLYIIGMVIYIIYGLRFIHKGQHKFNILLCLLNFLLGVLIMGVIVNNTGNAFRLRMNIVPFIIVACAMTSAQFKVNRETRILENRRGN